jgi:hypothetical protein
MTDKSAGGDDKRGFGGFGDLVSDVSKDIESATRESINPPTHQPIAREQTELPLTNKLPVSSQPTGGSSGAKWFWGIGIVMVILISIGNSGKEKSASYTPSPAYSPPTYAPTAIPTTEPTTPPASVYSPVLSKEDKPPIGNGLALSRDQIRYCISQKMRIDAIEKIVNTSRNGEVDSFNALVGDYNSRCSHFKYRRGSLEEVRAEVDGERSNIEAAAQHTWVRGLLGVESSQKSSIKPTPKITNPENNQYPVQTQEKALPATHPPSVGDPSLETNGTSSGKQLRIPANAVHNDYASQGWLCNSKYKQVGNECRYVEIPANAVHNDYVSQGWLCKSGFHQNGSECWPVVPSN